jgi:hypothetical protein
MALRVIAQVQAEVGNKRQCFGSIVPKKIEVLMETPPGSPKFFLER